MLKFGKKGREEKRKWSAVFGAHHQCAVCWEWQRRGSRGRRQRTFGIHIHHHSSMVATKWCESISHMCTSIDTPWWWSISTPCLLPYMCTSIDTPWWWSISKPCLLPHMCTSIDGIVHRERERERQLMRLMVVLQPWWLMIPSEQEQVNFVGHLPKSYSFHHIFPGGWIVLSAVFVFGFLGPEFSKKKGPGTKGPIWNSLWANWTLELDPPISFQNGSQAVFVFGFLGPDFSKKKGPWTKGPIWNNLWANWSLELDPPINFQNGSQVVLFLGFWA